MAYSNEWDWTEKITSFYIKNFLFFYRISDKSALIRNFLRNGHVSVNNLSNLTLKSDSRLSSTNSDWAKMMLKLIKYFSIIFLSCSSRFYTEPYYLCKKRCYKNRHNVLERSEVFKCYQGCREPTLKSIEYKPDEAKESQLGPATTIAENAVTNNCRN